MCWARICAHIREEECQGDATRRDESVHLPCDLSVLLCPPPPAVLHIESVSPLARKLALCDQASDSPSVRHAPLRASERGGSVECSQSVSQLRQRREKGVTDLAQEFDRRIVARMWLAACWLSTMRTCFKLECLHRLTSRYPYHQSQ